MKDLGVDLIHGDLHDRRSLKAAIRDVNVAYFVYPVAGGIVNAAANFAAAGREAGLERVVVMSMAVSNPESPSHLGRAQWLAEELLTWAGLSCIKLRLENLELLHAADIHESGVIQNSFRDVAVSWITGEDAGRGAVAALLHPERFPADSVYPTGQGTASHAEIAALIGKQLGRQVRHETISQEAWRDRLLALGASDPRVNADMASHISILGAAIHQDQEPNRLYEELAAQPPQTPAEALRHGRVAFI